MSGKIPMLPQRPPTPPKPTTDARADQTIEEALRYLDTSDEQLARRTLATPPTSSPAARSGKTPTLAQPSKKIRFEANATNIDQVLSDFVSPGSAQRLKDVPPNKDRKSLKSILKPTTSSLVDSSEGETDELSPRKPLTMPEILEDAFQKLAGGAAPVKAESYRTLSGCLRSIKQSEDEWTCFKNKISLLEEFIVRDLSQNDALANKAVTLQALKLTTVLFNPEFRIHQVFSSGYILWLYDNTLGILSSPHPNKERVKHQLILFTYSPFCESILTPNRAARLLEELLAVHDKITGLHIRALRLWIMTQIVEHQSSTMLNNIRRWLPMMFHAFLSNHAETRLAGINLAKRGSDSFGSHKRVSHAVVEFLDLASPVDESLTNYDILEKHIRRILKPDRADRGDRPGSDDILQVPRVWSSVIMFLRSSRQNPEQWPHLINWIQIMQPCFNASDTRVHSRAFLAWNHFIFATQSFKRTDSSILNSLCNPVFRYLQRRNATPLLARGRQAAISSFHLLVFFAFRPEAESKQWEMAWNQLVDRPMKEILPKDAAFARDFSQVLEAMFNPVDKRIWNPSMVDLRSSHPIQISNLPNLEPIWVKQHLSTHILPSISASLDLTVNGGSVAETIWSGMIKSLVMTCNKEIVPSKETRLAIRTITYYFVDRMNRLKAESRTRTDEEVLKDHMLRTWSLLIMSVRIIGASYFCHCDAEAAEPQIPLVVTTIKSVSDTLSVIQAAKDVVDLQDLVDFCEQSLPDFRLQDWMPVDDISRLRLKYTVRPRENLQVPALATKEHKTPQPRASSRRLRHNNSQVEFVPVESSPTAAAEADSQMLTGNQREVRQRQHEDAGVYTDLRSSSPIRAKSTPRSSRTQKPAELHDVNNNAEEAGTSSRHDGVDVYDVPSSPPDLPQNVGKPAAAPSIFGLDGQAPSRLPTAEASDAHLAEDANIVRAAAINKGPSIFGGDASSVRSNADIGDDQGRLVEPSHITNSTSEPIDAEAHRNEVEQQQHHTPEPAPSDDEVAGEQQADDAGIPEALSPDFIRAITHSPPQTRAVVRVNRLRTPRASQQQTVAPVEADTPSKTSVIAGSLKRKASSQPTASSSAKRSRVPDTVDPKKTASFPSAAADNENATSSQGGHIVLRRITHKTPSIFEVIRERQQAKSARSVSHLSENDSGLQEESPTPAMAVQRRRGRPRTRGRSQSQPSQSPSVQNEVPASSRALRSSGRRKKRKTIDAEEGSQDTTLVTGEHGQPLDTSVNDEPVAEQSSSKRQKMNHMTVISETASSAPADSSTEHANREAENEAAPQVPFTFTPPQQTPHSSQGASDSQGALSRSSTARLAQSVTSRLKDLFQDVKKLFMGDPAVEGERSELEDVYDELGQQIRVAGRRRR